MNTSRVVSLAFIPIVAVVLAGCGAPSDAGIYRSSDGGQTYLASSTLSPEGSIRGDQVLALGNSVARPQVVYAGLKSRGIVVTADGGATWRSTGVTSGDARDVAVHPSVIGTVYAAYASQVVVTNDDGVTFDTLYAEPGQVQAVAIDPALPGTLWAGSDSGQLVTTSDGGATWRVVQTFDDGVADILIPLKSTLVVVDGDGRVHLSTDSGATFVERTPTRELVTSPVQQDEIVAMSAAFSSTPDGDKLYVAGDGGLFVSEDLGANWTHLDDPISNAGVALSRVHVAIDNGSTLYISGDANIARTDDGGVTWRSRAVPTTRPAGPIVTVDAQTALVGIIGEGESFIRRALTN